ncbi:MAG: hypothetical protein COX57_03410 [Alphaproteobacteria bacterium CG_4_10_14_0_2_um_filter_63_37]|nr:MAG: hypothetical protein AUJ55_05685 [Proteobacteria bacterium CG1_02_64_396]PJA25450.1 MAG: hypothetical protein COX57_03410 [Alphaproteobacteria bacterium CG_4_10_14_0_2_um_filter_63_37]
MIKQRLALWVVGFGLSVLAIYPALNSPNYFDDFQNLIVNPWVQSFEPSWQYIIDYFHGQHWKRWVAFFSFGLDVYIHGGTLIYMRLESLAIHAGIGVLIFSLMIQWSRLFKVTPPLLWLAMGAMLWMLNPLLLDTPVYIVQRMTVLAAFFSLLSYWLWNRAWEEIDIQGWRSGQVIGWFWAAFLSLLLGLFSKEVAAMVVVVWVFDLWLLRKIFSTRVLMIVLSIILGMLYFVGGFVLQEDIFQDLIEVYQNREFTLGERLLTETRILWIYFFLLLAPSPDAVAFYLAPELSTGLFTPWTTAIAIMAHVAVFGVAVWSIRAKKIWLGFLIFGYYTIHSLESSIFPLQLAFEHRVYLPAAFAVSVGWPMLSYAVIKRGPRFAKLFLGIIVGMAVVWIVAAQNRAFEWVNPVLFWEEQIKKNPSYAASYHDYAVALLAQDPMSKKAGEMLDKAYDFDPIDFFTISNRVLYCLRVENGENLEKWWNILKTQVENPKLPPGSRLAIEGLAGYLASQGMKEKALYLLRFLVSDGMSPQVIRILATVHHLDGDQEKEEATLRQGMLLYSNMAFPYQDLATFLLVGERRQEAISTLKRGIARISLSSERKTLQMMLDRIQQMPRNPPADRKSEP